MLIKNTLYLAEMRQLGYWTNDIFPIYLECTVTSSQGYGRTFPIQAGKSSGKATSIFLSDMGIQRIRVHPRSLQGRSCCSLSTKAMWTSTRVFIVFSSSFS